MEDFYLENGRQGIRVIHDGYTQYAIWHPLRRTSEDGLLRGPGIEAIVIDPKTEYKILEDYGSGDSAWEKMFSVKHFYHEYGKCNGVGVDEDGQLILFNLYQIPPVIQEVKSRPDYRGKMFLSLLGYAYGNIYLRFYTTPQLSRSVSTIILRWVETFRITKLGPPPKNVEVNDMAEQNYDNFAVEVDPEKIIEIPFDLLYSGYYGTLFALERLKNPPKDGQVVRWWEQRKIPPPELSELTFDGQLELF